MDRTIMPDGTIVTTVTTVQSRPRVDGKLGKKEEPESPAVARAPKCRSIQDRERAKESPNCSRPWFQPLFPDYLCLSHMVPSALPFPQLFPSHFNPGSTSPSPGTLALPPPQAPSVFSRVCSPLFPQLQLPNLASLYPQPSGTLWDPSTHPVASVVFLLLPGALHDISPISGGPMKSPFLQWTHVPSLFSWHLPHPQCTLPVVSFCRLGIFLIAPVTNHPLVTPAL